MKLKRLTLSEGFRIVRGNRRSLVIEGSGTALVKKKRYTLLRTINFYVPPAYSPGGDPLPRGKK